jgi:hypothetical protein
MKKTKFIKIYRDLFTQSIEEILSDNLGIAQEAKKDFNARRLVARLSGMLSIDEPEVSEALDELIRLNQIV